MLNVIGRWMIAALLVALTTTGCGKKAQDEATRDQADRQRPADSQAAATDGAGKTAARSDTPAPAKAESDARDAGFGPVTSKLDAGGNLYVYLSTERAVQQMRVGIDNFVDMMALSVPPDVRAKLEAGRAFGLSALEEAGLFDISGIGLSSFQLDTAGLTRHVAVIYHPPTTPSRMLRTVLGQQAHAMESLARLPANVAAATYADFNGAAAWQWVNDRIADSGIPELSQGFAELVRDANREGVDLEAIFNSLDGGAGWVLTLDEANPVTLTDGNDTVTLPRPDLVFFTKTTDSRYFDLIDGLLAKSKAKITREDTADRQSRLLPVYEADGYALQLNLVATGGYVYIGTSPAAVANLFPGPNGDYARLVDTAEFKHYAQGIELNGNQYHWFGPLAVKVVDRLFEQALAEMPEEDAKAAKIGYPFLRFSPSFGVAKVTDEGLEMQANSANNLLKTCVLEAAPLPTAILGMLAAPATLTHGATAQRSVSMNNLRQLGLALLMYSGDHDGKFPAANGVAGLKPLVDDEYLWPSVLVAKSAADQPLTEANLAVVYLGGMNDMTPDAPAMPLAFDKPGLTPDGVNVLYVDGHVEYLEGTFATPAEVLAALIEKHAGRLSADGKAFLAKKLAELE